MKRYVSGILCVCCVMNLLKEKDTRQLKGKISYQGISDKGLKPVQNLQRYHIPDSPR